MLLKTMLVLFTNVRLQPHEIGKFRGYLNQQMGWQDALFHNHTDQLGGVIYRYPRIQYRVHQGCAALFAIGEGVAALQTYLNQHLDDLPEAFWTLERQEERTRLELRDTRHTYHLHQWLGLNTILNRDGTITDLAATYEVLTADDERRDMLGRILTAQLLKFCSQMECRLPKGQLQVRVDAIEDTGRRTLHSQTGQITTRSFRLQYSTNLCLPNYVAFGKGISKGYGWQIRSKPY